MKQINDLIILAIETSCDDTCIAILEIKNSKAEHRDSWTKRGKRTKLSATFKIRSNIVSSQVKLHKKYGGVYPFLAKREHQRNLPLVLSKALKEANLAISKINLIAVTVGPGLEPCLWVGVNFAKELAKKLKIPIIPVNHIEAHILANWLAPISENSKSQILNPKQILNSKFQNLKLFPAICLVVSGGHSQLILMKDIDKYRIIGETRDDAAGECLDKTARILGLGYPGGPTIAAQAAKFSISNYASEARVGDKGGVFNDLQFSIKLPRPMIYQKNYDFSFSGLKTAVLYDFKNRSSKTKKSQQYIREMSGEIQQAIIDVLIKKTMKAAKDYEAKSIILGGGVSANEELRKQLKNKIEKVTPPLQYFLPDVKYSTDNAVMIALTGYFNRQRKKNWKKIKVNANLKIGEKHDFRTSKNLRTGKS